MSPISIRLCLALICLTAGCGKSSKQVELANPVAKSAVQTPIVNGPISEGPVAVGMAGAVTSAEANATDIGLAVLREGGNAVDAAIATGFALGVTHPSAGNIGGGGFMVIRLADGTATTIDYREMAPGAATADMYVGPDGTVTEDSRYGPKAAGIPGVVAGFWMAHQKYGKLPWSRLVTPAVKLARDGWALDSFHAEDLGYVLPRIADYKKRVDLKQTALLSAIDATVQTFSKADGTPYNAGDLWKQPALANTLEAIAKDGRDAFYRGPIAAHMAQSVQAMGGIWTAKDLAGYDAVVREPIRFKYHDHEIITMPPPSAGGLVLRQVLAAADTLHLEKLDWDSADRTHLYVEALRRTYADRNQLLGDPDFIDIPMDKLLNVDYMTARMSNVDPNKATLSSDIGSGVEYQEKKQTTHFSVVDRAGIAVSNTYTLNGGFGGKVQIPNTGVTLNNEMDDFTAKVGSPNMFGLIQGPQNAIAPGKRMLSSMSPTIILKKGKLRAVLGSPGGPTISTTVAQIALQLIDHNRSLEQAVAAPRVHHQWLPDMIWHEASLSKEVSAELVKRGHKMREARRIGHANCIEIDADGKRHAIADVARDGGKAAAY